MNSSDCRLVLTVRIDFGRLIGLLFLLALAFTVVMWPLSLWGHAIHLTPSWHQLMNRDHDWMHKHYPLVGLRYVGAAVLLTIAVYYLASLTRRATQERTPEPHRE